MACMHTGVQKDVMPSQSAGERCTVERLLQSTRSTSTQRTSPQQEMAQCPRSLACTWPWCHGRHGLWSMPTSALCLAPDGHERGLQLCVPTCLKRAGVAKQWSDERALSSSARRKTAADQHGRTREAAAMVLKSSFFTQLRRQPGSALRAVPHDVRHRRGAHTHRSRARGCRVRVSATERPGHVRQLDSSSLQQAVQRGRRG